VIFLPILANFTTRKHNSIEQAFDVKKNVLQIIIYALSFQNAVIGGVTSEK
jgi:hypothetical protein